MLLIKINISVKIIKSNIVNGKVGIELLQIYGSRDKYLSAVEESALHPEVNAELQEELKNIYFSFRDSSGELNETLELVKRLEDNTKKMYRTANARYILLKVAEGYLAKDKTAQIMKMQAGSSAGVIPPETKLMIKSAAPISLVIAFKG